MTTFKLNVFDIKRFATHDGAGIRTTVFFKGCPLRCRWCQNPEGLKPVRQILYMENKCIHCLTCAHLSKNGGVSVCDGKIVLNREIDEDWDSVVDHCCTEALRYDSSYYSLEQLVEEVKKDEAFFKREGGITVSGGEPLMQGEALAAFLKACKEEGLHTAIETSLYASKDLVRKVLPYLDQIYADCKLFDEAKHRAYTGVDNTIIKENIRTLLSSDKRDRVIIRTPLIPTMTADEENIAAIARFISDCYPDVHYEILNYNPLAKSKYAYLDMDFCFDENPQLYTKEEMDRFYTIAAENGVKNLIRE